MMENGSSDTYTTPIDTYNVNRYVAVSYAKMKRPTSIEVVSPNNHDIDINDKPRTKSLLNGSFFNNSFYKKNFDENDNNGLPDGIKLDIDLGPDGMSTPKTDEMLATLPELISDEAPVPDPPVDVVIVGAGLSGLTAAYNLRKANPDLSIVVLEAKDHVGGRTFSPEVETATGSRRFDLGDQWVNDQQKTVMELLREFNLETYPEYWEGKNLLVYPDGTTEEYSGNIYPINPLRRLDISSFVSRIESMREDLSKKDPTDLSESLQWDSITLEQFKKEHIWTDAARQVFDSLVVFNFGVTPREMSLLFFCHVLNSTGGWKNLFGEDKAFPMARQLKIKGGAQQLCEALAEDLDIHLNDPVTTIDQSDKELTEVVTESGHKYRTKRVIVATAVDHSVRIMHKPDIPLKRECLTRLMPTGYCIKYVVTYEKAFWRKKGMSGHVLKLIDEEKAFDNDSELLSYEFVYDACACNRDPEVKAVENPALMGRVYAESMRQMTAEERKDIILRKLSTVFGEEALNIIDYAEMDWGADRYTSGFPFSTMMPGAMVYHGKALKKPLGSVYWCGAETATSWYGTMEGSVRSGKRVARDLAKDLKEDEKSEKEEEWTADEQMKTEQSTADEQSTSDVHSTVDVHSTADVHSTGDEHSMADEPLEEETLKADEK